MSAGKRKPITLNPVAPQHQGFSDGERQNELPGWKPFTGTQNLPLVDIGAARPRTSPGRTCAASSPSWRRA